ncbi:pRL2-8 [Streptomyces sp. NBC_00356]
MVTLRKPCPPRQCPQCWAHAYDPAIHKRLRPGEQCGPCLDHMVTECGGFYRK